jgi:hypothetical protein
MPDWTELIYQHYRESGDPGDEILTDTRPWLTATYGIEPDEARRIRDRANKELKRQRRIERVNVRTRRLRILT